jgi:hypothetical protein
MGNMVSVCTGNNYEKECLIYPRAMAWRDERRKKSLLEHCPFAYNTFCGKPWLWVCKGVAPIYFPLTEIETDQHDLPIRGEDGDITFKPGKSIADIKDTCLSGDEKIYLDCPNYKTGIEYREYLKSIKKGETV